MSSNTEKPSESPAQRLHREGFERLQRQVQPEFDAARQPHNESVETGRNVGGLELPIVREGMYQLPPDNGAEYPGPGTPPPAQPLEKQ